MRISHIFRTMPRMTCYRVGGAVRDTLLGYPHHETDWVVVGSTPEEMIAEGYTQVGRDFPVFLHPETKEEYALARTERKSGPGYHGFVVHADPSVTLEEDLERRDLTINAMAMDESGAIIDPYGGQPDLEAKTLRHVSPHFIEDALRVLPGWTRGWIIAARPLRKLQAALGQSLPLRPSQLMGCCRGSPSGYSTKQPRAPKSAVQSVYCVA